MKWAVILITLILVCDLARGNDEWLCKFHKLNGNTAYHPMSKIYAIVWIKDKKHYRVRTKGQTLKGGIETPNIFRARSVTCRKSMVGFITD